MNPKNPGYLTPEEKQNGKRTFLEPSDEIKGKMQPISRESFRGMVKKFIVPSLKPAKAAK